MLTSHSTDFSVRTRTATVHGRFLVRDGPPQRLLVGFHGYAENAERHLSELMHIDGIERWTVAAVQALHPFYAQKQIVASWMTSQDRELAIADNIEYVRTIVASFPSPKSLVFIGFSQGVAMAYRAAASHPNASGLIALAGDVPPDVTTGLPPVLVARGTKDDWYDGEKLKKDLKFLEGVTAVRSFVFEGGHEWTGEFRREAAEFLRRF